MGRMREGDSGRAQDGCDEDGYVRMERVCGGRGGAAAYEQRYHTGVLNRIGLRRIGEEGAGVEECDDAQRCVRDKSEM